jgi:hypothetical protein
VSWAGWGGPPPSGYKKKVPPNRVQGSTMVNYIRVFDVYNMFIQTS